MTTIQLLILLAGSAAIAWISRKSLRDPRTHGFYRFIAWEIILVLFALNMKYWFVEPFSLRQIFAWSLLILSAVLILWSVMLFRQRGRLDPGREDDPALVGIEKTTQLVTTGLYRYIRHPFYSSLLFLAWGIACKQLGWLPVGLASAATLALYFTARREEDENTAYFGPTYQEYMQRTKRFIPFIF